MTLLPGVRLGPYEILDLIGAGGMGEVYRARDVRLDRIVALKILPAHVASNAERRARFALEARAVSALSHPYICTLYDVGEREGSGFLVMEYVTGETLARRLAQGPLPMHRAIECATWIAEALDAAHRQGIIHRDLKPGNVMLTRTGIKLLDFGVAKIAGRDERALVEVSPSALTQVEPITEEGTLVGTLQYMAPEQLQGLPVDARADLWALGAILYEMVTGQRAFDGRNAASVIGAILEREPAPLTSLQPLTPPALDRVIRRCLAKDPEQRWFSAHDLADELRWITQPAVSALGPAGPGPERHAEPGPAWRRPWILALGAALVAGVGGIATWRQSKAPSPDGTMSGGRIDLLVSSESGISDPAISPDGTMVVYVTSEDGRPDLFVSRVAGGAKIRLTNDEAREQHPTFSPDGERVAFVRRTGVADAPDLLVVPTFGGDAVPVRSAAAHPSWSPDGTRLVLVSQRPGRPQELTTSALDGSDERMLLRADDEYPFFRGPAWSPDGRRIVVVRSSGGVAGELWMVTLDGRAASRLRSDAPGVFAHDPVFTPDGAGILHSSNRGGSTNLWVQPVNGESPVRLTSGAGPDTSPSMARDGTVAFLNARHRTALLVYDLQTGQPSMVHTHSSFLWAPAFSPDGKELAYSQAEADGLWHIWTVAVSGGATRQLTAGNVPEIYPRFAPDGRSILYCTWAPGRNQVMRVGRTGGRLPDPVREAGGDEQYADVSPDGRRVAFVRTERGASHIYVAALDGQGPATRLSSSVATLPRWSPDGRSIAFTRTRGADSGIFVIGADGSGERQLVTTGGWPVWFPDGGRLGYVVVGADETQQVWVLPFDGSAPSPLGAIRFNGTNNPFDISPDGRLLATTDSYTVSSEIWSLRPRQ